MAEQHGGSTTVRAFGFTERPPVGEVAKHLVELSVPAIEPAAGEALVRVHASAVNLDDVLLAQGTSVGRLGGPEPSRERPYIPGMDFSGTVARVGAGVSRFRPGDEVLGMILPSDRRGAWSLETCVPEGRLFRKPPELGFREAATYSTSALAAYAAVAQAGVGPGQRCVVVGASGGVGHLIVQLLRSRGAWIAGVCGAAHAETVRSLGAIATIDYAAGPLRESMELMGARTFDAVLDCVGGREPEEAARSVLRRSGVYVTLVGPERFIGRRKLTLPQQIGMFLYMVRRSATSSIVGPRYRTVFPSLSLIPDVIDCFAQAGVRVLVERAVPFDGAAIREAIERVYSRHAGGKLVIDVQGA